MRMGIVALWGGADGRADQVAPAAINITDSSKRVPTNRAYLFMVPLLTSSIPCILGTIIEHPCLLSISIDIISLSLEL